MQIPDKTLTDKDLAKIINRATEETCLIDDADTYEAFLTELATLITYYFGGDVKSAGHHNGQWQVVFGHDEEVPPGSIFDDYDKENIWPTE